MKKDTFKLALSLLPIQFIVSLLTFMSLPITFAVKSNFLIFVIAVFQCIVLYSMLYIRCWQEGWKDPNKVKLGQIEFFHFKGLVAGLLCFIPSYLLAIALFSKQLFVKLLLFIFNMNFININSVFPNKYYILYIIYFLLAPLFCYLGYILGYKRISLYHKIVFIKPKNK